MPSKNTPAGMLWSKLGQGVDNPPVDLPQPTKPTEPTVNPSMKKAGLVLKRKDDTAPNAASPSVAASGFSRTPTKQFSWADDSDDDLFQPQMSSHPQAQRVVELEAVIANNVARIGELERELEAKTHCVSKLEGALNEKESRIAIMEDANKTQEFALHRYINEVDEKDRRITQLESEIEQKVSHIRELELRAVEQAVEPTPSEPLTPSTAIEYPASGRAASEHTPSKHHSPTVSKKMPGLSAEEYPALSQTEPKHAPETAAPKAVNEPEPAIAKTTPAKADSVTPAPCDSKEPIFATPQTIKQAAPVPPAPVLKMGLDMSKWGKKTTTRVNSTSHTQGHSGPKRNVDPTIVPTIDPVRDVRKMPRHEREPLGNGGDVEIKMGNQSLGKVPKFMLMQCSYIANEHFTKNPKAKSITFPEGSMDVTAVGVHIDWMQQHCFVSKVFSIGLNSEHSDERNLNIVRASRVLGLNNTYVGHFTRQYCDKIRDQDLSYDLMNLIASLVYPKNDPIFDCLANNIANQRHRDNVTDPEGLNAFLEQHPFLAHKVQQIERRYASNRKAGCMSRRLPSNMLTSHRDILQPSKVSRSSGPTRTRVAPSGSHGR